MKQTPHRRIVAVVFLALTLSGCGLFVPPLIVRGNRTDPADLAKLVPGTTTEAQTRDLLGSPTSVGTFDQNHWYYITQETRQAIGGTQGVHDQSVIVLRFDSAGVLRGMKRIAGKDALAAPIIARTTPSPGGSPGFFQQLLGNVGRIGPDLGSQSGGGSLGGAPVH